MTEEASTIGILGRVLVFVALVALAYAAFRQLTVVLFAPELEVIRPVLPERSVSPSSSVTLGVLVLNSQPSTGAAFVVASMDDGRTIEGPTVEVPPNDTTFVPVDVQLEREDQVLSLVVFDGWRGVRRLNTYSGLSVGVTEQEITVDEINVPDTVRSGDGFTLQVVASNHSSDTLTVRARVSFESGPFIDPSRADGDAVAMAPGDALSMVVSVGGTLLGPGLHLVRVGLESEEGVRRGGTRFPVPLFVSR